ncbi:FAD-dependent oxidoreductase [Candidatus Bathyarchaeota archaeon]|nr:FAD-dependent oxidoreductase [Candidatus Bathyarchaeota archaeon]
MVEARSKSIDSTKPSSKLVGEVLVVGVGVAGIQASLDLTRLGYHVTAIDKSMTIGGIMAQLDKTFPTNDCSLCILAPKMVEVYRDPNITLYQNTELKEIEFLANGNLKVTLEKKRLGIDEEACKNCSECYNACPVRFQEDISWFDAGLNMRHAANIPFPSAVPPVYGIDPDKCLHVNFGICGKCQDICPANCIDFDFTSQIIEITVGSILFATGSTQMDPSMFPTLAGEHPDVLNGIQFERLMCASGPEGGEIIKLSTRQHAHRIAFLQCVGSRSKKEGELEFCSSVCCMYAMKEAQITKEHDPDVECMIFNTENRACAKGFHEYYLRAKDDYGVKFMQGRVASVKEDLGSQDLIIAYEDIRTGKVKEEPVDLVILETALVPNTKPMADILGIELNEHHYFDPGTVDSLQQKGIFLAGYNIKPMDIPLSVVSGSAAAAQIARRLSKSRFDRIVEKEFPPEKNIRQGDEPRIGIMVCHCGINIGRTVDVEWIAEEIQKEPNVVVAIHNYYSCSSDSQVTLKEMIREHDLNRFIVASCTPRTHEPLFRVTLQEAGLNPYLFELVNIREHVSWVHMQEPELATQKALELLKMNVAKVRGLQPQQRKKIDIKKTVLIIGGGPAGLHAAWNLAKQGFAVHLVEKEGTLGGAVNKISREFVLPRERAILEKLDALLGEIRNEDNISLHMNAHVDEVSGFVGNYNVTIVESSSEEAEVEVGAIIVATGAVQDPTTENVAGGNVPRVYTQEEFEKLIEDRTAGSFKKVVFIQCTNQRDDGNMSSDFPNCSGICCKISLKQAMMLHEADPSIQITILHRGMQLSGDINAESLFDDVQRFAAIARYSPDNYPSIEHDGENIAISLDEVNTGMALRVEADAVVLATPFRSISNTKDLAMKLKVPVTHDGYFLEAHVKLRPVDFATEGIFLAGSAQWPKTLDDAVMQGLAAAGRAAGLLAKGFVEVEGITARVDEEACIGCGKCAEVCPYSAIEMIERDLTIDMVHITVPKAHVMDAMCKGCGTCVGECPTHAIDQRHFKTSQISDMIKALFPVPGEDVACRRLAP